MHWSPQSCSDTHDNRDSDCHRYAHSYKHCDSHEHPHPYLRTVLQHPHPSATDTLIAGFFLYTTCRLTVFGALNGTRHIRIHHVSDARATE